jgi:uncharacterized protein YdaU (DUF1376 family)
VNYYEHHLGDYAAATAHLSWDEDMAYSRLLRAYYHSEKPLPADVKDVCRLVRASSAVQRKAVDAVLREFFALEEDGWHQKRCDEEIDKCNIKKNKARESANARWVGMRTHSERIANAMPAQCEGNAPNLQTPGTKHQTPEEQRAAPPKSVAAQMSVALRDLGVIVTVDHPTLRQWVTDGFTPQQVTDATALARQRKPHPEPIPANYIDRILRQPARPPPLSQLDRVTWRPPPDEATG